ncbi:MAG: transporter substrate-binding domain-containing protein [Gammaproteobacteria bacterium]|nr:transporter substrate-binding domain-containing protein [Gammaproteobacteria bacterium]
MLKPWFLLILCSIPIIATASGEVLEIFVRREGAPKQFQDEDGATSGYAAEIAIKAIENAGYRPKVTHLPWKRAQLSALEGNGILTGFSKTAERSKHYYFSQPLYEDRVILIQKRANTFPFDDFNDLVGKKIGINRGSNYSGDFPKFRDLLSLSEDPGNGNRLQMLAMGRIDAGIFSGDIYTLRYQAKKLGLDIDQFVVANKPIAIDPNYIGIPKNLHKLNASQVLEKLNQAIIEMHDRGVIREIRARYR